MANVFIPGMELHWPGWFGGSGVPNNILDAAGEMCGHTGRITYAGVINKIHFRLGPVAQASVNGLKVSFQGRQDVGNYAVPDETPTHFRVVPQADLIQNSVVATGLMTDDGTDTGA